MVVAVVADEAGAEEEVVEVVLLPVVLVILPVNATGNVMIGLLVKMDNNKEFAVI